MKLTHHGAGHIDTRMYRQGSIDPIHVMDADRGDIECGIPMVFAVELTASVTTKSWTLPCKIKVIDAWTVKTTGTGGAGDVVDIDDGTTAIATQLDLENVTDKTITRFAEIDDATSTLLKGETLDVTGASAVTCIVYIMALKYA